MTYTMSRADLVLALKASLHDVASVFDGDTAAPDANFERFLLQALPDMQIKRPATRLGTVELRAGVARMSVGSSNAGFAAFKTYLWGDDCKIKPWSPDYPGTLPRVSASFEAGQWWLNFSPAPSGRQISVHGSQFDFWYYAQHTIGELPEGTTIGLQDRGLLILRAQVEAMRELAIRNAGKPVAMRDGVSGQSRNSTPSAMADALMRQFLETP
jgi:hypothetical protein